MEGTGEGITLQVQADFEYVVSVFSGDSCDALSCLTTEGPDDFLFGIDDIIGSLGNTTFFSQIGTTYFIALENRHGDADDFQMTIQGGGKVPPNSECSAAQSLQPNEEVLGSTTFASTHEGLECNL